ncbi:MAG TPA: DNA-processing protein DprA [Bacillales bacterium]|nr:DNA-processing protein DprA [Bacillales bacterium]
MAAWATHVIVVEAGKKSGALTTADFAMKYGQEVFAVPNRIDVPESRGPNGLFRHGVSPYLDFSSLLLPQDNVSNSPFDEDNNVVLLIQKGPKTVDHLANQLNVGEKELREQIFELELQGMVYLRGETVTLS